jgi:hypothetical protein
MEDDVKDAQDKAKEVTEKVRGERGGGFKSLAAKVAVPVGAALTSAAVSYATRKVPRLFEQHVLPRLRERGDPRDIAGDVMQRVRDVVESHTPIGGGAGSARSDGGPRPRVSDAERERERAGRAARRRERKTAAR